MSASSVTGVPAVATIAVVGTPLPRSPVSTSMTSVVVPERVITRTASYPRCSLCSLAAKASVSPCPACSRSAAKAWAM